MGRDVSRLLIAPHSAHGNPAYERLWSICDGQTNAPHDTSSRLRACDTVIRLGPHGANLDRKRNTLRYVGAFADRAALHWLLNNYEQSIAAYSQSFELAIN